MNGGAGGRGRDIEREGRGGGGPGRVNVRAYFEPQEITVGSDMLEYMDRVGWTDNTVSVQNVVL